MNVYLQSKLRKLMTQIKFIMQDSLRYLAEISNAAFAKLITNGTALDVEVKSFDEVISTVCGASGDGKRPAPLFVLDVLLAPKTNKLQLSHNLDVVKALPLKLFDAATQTMQGILNLEPQVLSNMFWPEKPELSAPDKNDPTVAEQRKQISHAMDKAIQPLFRYLESLAPLEAVLQIDTAAVIKQWEAATPEAIAAQLQAYQAKRNSMDEKIPKQIVVGCFTVVTDRVRKSVVAKYMELIEGLGGAIATATRKKADVVSRSFDEIFVALKRPPNDIEEIVAAREYAAGLAPTLNDLKAQVEQAMYNYDLLDGLFYNYSNSDMKQRWHIFELPNVVQSKIMEAQKMYTAKESEMDQEQTQIQEDFNDEIKSLDKIVKGFASRIVVWKPNEGVEGTALEAVADEVIRLQKRILEADVSARKFNSREVLFGKPQTDYSEIAKITKAFEPYTNLWLTMRDFQKARKKWMSDPFTTLDAEEVEKSISTWWRTMFKICKTFQVERFLPF
jgi:dynein heavy chain